MSLLICSFSLFSKKIDSIFTVVKLLLVNVWVHENWPLDHSPLGQLVARTTHRYLVLYWTTRQPYTNTLIFLKFPLFSKVFLRQVVIAANCPAVTCHRPRWFTSVILTGSHSFAESQGSFDFWV